MLKVEQYGWSKLTQYRGNYRVTLLCCSISKFSFWPFVTLQIKMKAGGHLKSCSTLNRENLLSLTGAAAEMAAALLSAVCVVDQMRCAWIRQLMCGAFGELCCCEGVGFVSKFNARWPFLKRLQLLFAQTSVTNLLGFLSAAELINHFCILPGTIYP